MSGQQILAVCQGKMDLKCQGKMDLKFVQDKSNMGIISTKGTWSMSGGDGTCNLLGDKGL